MAGKLTAKLEIAADGSAAVSAVKAVDAALDKVAGTASKAGKAQAQAASDANALASAQRKGEQAAASLNKIYTELRAQVGGPLVAAQQKYAGTLADLQRAEAQLTNAQRGSIVIQGQLSRARADATTALANETAAAQKGAGSVSALSGVYGNLRTAVLGYASIAGASAILSQGDQYQTLVAKLKSVTGSQEEFNLAYSSLIQISKTNGTELGNNAQLYARLSRATSEAGVSQTDLIKIVGSVNSALRINGATTAEAQSAVLQLSQAFGSGRLNGEEFNAVNEAAPQILTALAKSMDVPRASLKKLAEDGKLTTDELVKALTGANLALAAEAEKVPLGLTKAFQNLRTTGFEYIGQADAALGATQTLAAGVNFVSENLGGLVRTLGIAAVGYGALRLAKTGFVTSLVAGNVAISASAVATTALAGASRLATVAYAALGGPIGLAIVGITAITALWASYSAPQNAATNSLKEYNDQLERSEALAQSPQEVLVQNLQKQNDALIAIADTKAKIDEINSRPSSDQVVLEIGQISQLNATLKDQEAALQANSVEIIRLAGNTDSWLARGITGLASVTSETSLVGAATTALGNQVRNLPNLFDQLLGRTNSGELASQVTALGNSVAEAIGRLTNQDLEKRGLNPLVEQFKKLKAEGADIPASLLAQIVQLERLDAKVKSYSSTAKASAVIKRQGVKDDKDVEQSTNFVAQAYASATQKINVKRAAEEASAITLLKLNVILEEGKVDQELVTKAIQAVTEAREKELAGIEKQEAAKRRQAEVGGRVLDQLDQEIKLGGLSARQRQIEIALLEEIRAGYVGNANAMRAEIAARLDIIEVQGKQKESIEQVEQATSTAAENMNGAFDEFLLSGGKGFVTFREKIKDEFKGLVLEMLSIGRQGGQGLFSSLLSGLGGGSQTGGQAPGGNLLSRLFGGGTPATADEPGSQSFLGSIIGYGGGNPVGSSGAGGLLGAVPAIAAQFGGALTGLVGTGGAIGAFANGLGVAASGGLGAATSFAATSAAAGSFAGALGAAIPVIGQIALVASVINSLAGGRLFGTKFTATGNTASQLNFGGEAGFSGQNTAEFTRRRSLFRGNKTENRASALSPEQLQQGQDFAAQVTAQLQADAAVTGRSVATIISASFKAELDKNGKVIKEGGTIAGTFYAEGIAAFQSRLFAESRINQLGPEASAIAAQWRTGTADVLASGAAFLVASAAAIKGGFGIAGESLADSLDLVNKLKTPTESINEGFVRLVASSGLLRDAIAATGGTAKLTGAAFTEFSASLVAGLGGLERANGIVSSVIEGIFTAAERQIIQENAARASATGLAAAAGFTGIASVAALKPRVQQALSGELSAEDARAVLEYAAAVSAFNRIVASGTQAVDSAADSESSLARNRTAAAEQYATLSREIAAEVAQGNPRTLVQQIQAINRGALERVAQLQAEARAAGLAAAASGDLANAHLAAARTGAAAYATLERSVRSSINSLYPVASDLDRFIRQFGDVEFAITDGGTFRRPDAPADNGRFLQAAEIAAQVRQLAEVGGRNALDLIARFGAPLDNFAADLGINLANLGTAGGFDSFVQGARQLGVELPEFAARLGISIGVLADASSRVNDGFERALSGVEDSATRDALLALLRNLENSTTDEARSTNTDALAGAIANLSPDLQSLFAPFLDQIDTTSAADLQLIEARELNGYQLIANGHLGAIAKGIEGITTATPQAESSRSLERSIAQAAEREIESTDGVALAVNNLAASVLASQAETRKLQGDMAALLQRLVRGG